MVLKMLQGRLLFEVDFSWQRHCLLFSFVQPSNLYSRELLNNFKQCSQLSLFLAALDFTIATTALFGRQKGVESSSSLQVPLLLLLMMVITGWIMGIVLVETGTPRLLNIQFAQHLPVRRFREFWVIPFHFAATMHFKAVMMVVQGKTIKNLPFTLTAHQCYVYK